jgi:hypothetical protein
MGRLCFRTDQDFGVKTKLSRCGMAHFLPSGYRFIVCELDCDTILLNGGKIVPVQGTGKKKKEGLGPYSTTTFCSAGLSGHQAKSVPNNLPILSVLAVRVYFRIPYKLFYLISHKFRSD